MAAQRRRAQHQPASKVWHHKFLHAPMFCPCPTTTNPTNPLRLPLTPTDVLTKIRSLAALPVGRASISMEHDMTTTSAATAWLDVADHVSGKQNQHTVVTRRKPILTRKQPLHPHPDPDPCPNPYPYPCPLSISDCSSAFTLRVTTPQITHFRANTCVVPDPLTLDP